MKDAIKGMEAMMTEKSVKRARINAERIRYFKETEEGLESISRTVDDPSEVSRCQNGTLNSEVG